MATFSEVLALLIEHEVPLDEAVILSGEASGDALLSEAAAAMAQRLRGGQRGAELPPAFPPLLAWMITSGTRREQLAKSLRQSADSYRRRARSMGNWLTIYLPMLLSAGIGGVIALLYVLLVMAPFYNLLFQLSMP